MFIIAVCVQKYSASNILVPIHQEINEPYEDRSDGHDINKTDQVFISSNEIVLMQTASTSHKHE